MQLLDLFRTRRDETSDEAFRVLVERHGAMVHAVCRRVLGTSSDCDDAFQATFLVLVQKARSIRKGDSLASWLHGVALRASRRARDQGRRRRSIVQSADHEALARHADREEVSLDASAAIHEEIERLPSRLREPLILCCLEGRSYEEAARALGLNEPSLRGRLHRGRKKLEARLKQRGELGRESLGSAWLAGGPAPKLLEVVVSQAARSLGSSLPIPDSINTLAKGAIFAMSISSIKSMAAATALVGVFVLGTAVVAQQGKEAPTEAAERSAEQAPTAKASEPARKPTKEEIEKLNAMIAEALDQPFRTALPTPLTLEGLLKTIKQDSAKTGYSGIAIYVDSIGLSEAELTLLSELPGDWNRFNMGHVLEQSLRILKLDYFINDGFLMISSSQNVLRKKLELLDKKLDRVLRAVERSTPKE
jgi:RNA polymerase sigma factor (sigma-70 family)